MKKTLCSALVITAFLLLAACSDGDTKETGASAESNSARTFEPMGVNELDTFLAANKGTPTILMFWTTWCPSCKKELPELEKLRQTHGDKVNIITVSLDEKREALEKYFEEHSLDLPVYYGDEAIARKFSVQAIPTLVMFDGEGQQVFAQPGVFPHEMLTGMAEKLAGN